MSEYHIKFDPPRRDHQRGPNRGPGPGPNRNPRNNGGGLLGVLVELFVSLLLSIPSLIASLVRALARADRPDMPPLHIDLGQHAGQSWTGQTAQSQTAQAAVGQTAGQSATATSAQTSAKADKRLKPTAGRGSIILGAILLAIFGTGFATCLAEGAGAAALVATGIFTGGGLLALFAGLRKRRKARLYLRYLALIGRRESVGLTTLAKAAGRSRKKVCRELQEMLDLGVLPTGYLDLAGDRLVLSAQGIDEAPVEEPKPTDENDILRQIKEVNDAIPDPVMSAKIDRIGEITGKILDYQRENPGKAGQLRSFLNYYLPTTLKILEAYAQLDQQGVEGTNISAAKARIEGMMDKVVEGFEKQLDRLFQDDALDITSDVAVLEQMLDKDGLGSGGFTMGL